MIGTTRSRRLCAGLAGAVLLIAIAGCTAGTTTIAAGNSGWLGMCPRDGATPSAFWDPGPDARYLRFEAMGSDATQPLSAEADWGPFTGNGEWLDFGLVWDGTKSTGPKQVDLRSLQLGIPEFILWISTPNTTASQEIHVDWIFTALDADGNDVGFTCTVPS
jgi:hypothetical protein